MILKDLKDIESLNYQVVIIGSGPAGVSLALTLEKEKINSIIIETGEKDYNVESQKNYEGKANGDLQDDISTTRLRQFGGTSGHWGGWCHPLESYDFIEWPIKKSEIDFFLEDACSILEIKKKFNTSRINKNFNQTEFQYSQVRFAEKYFEHIKKSNQIHLILNTQFSLFDGNNGVVDSALLFSNNVEKKIYSKFFILACGGIENSRLLLWNQKKNPHLLNKNLPIGNYWMIHPWVIAGDGLIYRDKVIKISKLDTDDNLLHFSTSHEFTYNNLAGSIYLAPFENIKLYKKFITDIICVAPEYGKKIFNSILNKNIKCGNIFLHLEDKKDFNNKITLSEDKDIFNIPKCVVNYKFKEDVVKSAKKIMENFAKCCIENDLGRISVKNNILNLKKLETLGAHHHIGGTIMGLNEKNSVVDKNLKVHGLKNLYIAGSSTFSSTGYANPTLTIVQLSIRLAGEIKKNLNV